MRVAFVGIEKDWKQLEKDDYVFNFVKYHLELPWYYSVHGCNDVDVVSDYETSFIPTTDKIGSVNQCRVVTPETFLKRDYDVVIHWRKWFEHLYKEGAINVINSQDHSYGHEWLNAVEKASHENRLRGILCFPTWHERRLKEELSYLNFSPRLLSGVTLGVDTQIYCPAEKERHRMLWASDPGRGLQGAIEVAVKLFQRDKSFRLHVCWPDYVSKGTLVSHPAIVNHLYVKNGTRLWSMFNRSAFVPYTSQFMEPSSRTHRQGMAAGCVVLYPPDRGTPSELLTDGVDGFVRPVDEWVDIIYDLSRDGKRFDEVSRAARDHAVRENWKVQAQRFNELFEELING